MPTLSAPVPDRRRPADGTTLRAEDVAEEGAGWATKSFLRSAATVLGREITRGMLGTAKKRRR